MILNKQNNLTVPVIQTQKLPAYDEIGYSNVNQNLEPIPIKPRKKSEFVTLSFTKNRTEQFKYEALNQNKETVFKFISKPDMYMTLDHNNIQITQLTHNDITKSKKNISRTLTSFNMEASNLTCTFSVHKSLLSKTKYLINILNVCDNDVVGDFVWIKPGKGVPSVETLHLIDCKVDKVVAKFSSRPFGIGIGDIVFLKALPNYQIELFTTVLAYIMDHAFI